MTDINNNIHFNNDYSAADLAADDGYKRNTQITHLEELLSRPGVFTLDDDGNLTVVNPERPKNVIVRALKWVFSSDYRAESRARDRLQTLHQNVNFNKTLVKCFNEAGLGLHSIQDKSILQSKLNAFLKSNELNNIDTSSIKNIKEGCTSFSKLNLVSRIASNLDSDGTIGNKITYKGNSFSFAGFLKTFLGTKNYENFDMKDLQNNMLCQLLSADSRTRNAFIKNNNALQFVKNYLENPNHDLEDSVLDREELNRNLASVLKDCNNHFADFIKDKLEKGYTPESIAKRVMEKFVAFSGMSRLECNLNLNALLDYFGPNSDNYELVKADNAVNYKEPEAGSPLYANYMRLKEAAPRLTPERLSSILKFTKNDDTMVTLYIKTLTNRNNLSITSSIDKITKSISTKDFNGAFIKGVDEVNRIVTTVLTDPKTGEISDNSKETRDKVISCMVHYFTTKDEGKNVIDDFFNLKGVRHDLLNTKLHGIIANDPDTKNRIDTLKTVLDNILKTTQSAQLGRVNMDKGREDFTFVSDSLYSGSYLNKLDFKQEIEKVLGNAIPNDKDKEQMVLLLSKAVKNFVANHSNETNKDLGGIIKNFKNEFVKHKADYLKMIFDASVVAGDEIAQNMASDDGMKKVYMSLVNTKELGEVYDVDENNNVMDRKYPYHVKLNEGLFKGSVRNIGNFNFASPHLQNASKVKFIEEFFGAFRNVVPYNFRGFVSTLLSSDGIASFGKMIGQSFMPDSGVEDPDNPFTEKYMSNAIPSHEIVKEGNNLIIKTTLTVTASTENSKDLQDLPIQTYVVTTTIDTSKGTDKFGVPLGITYKSSYEGPVLN